MHDLEFTQGSVSYAQVEGEPAPWWAFEDFQPVIVPKDATRRQWELAANFNFTVDMHTMATNINGDFMEDDKPVVRPVRTWFGGANDGKRDLLGKPFTESYGLVTPAEMLDFADQLVELSDGKCYIATLGSVRNGNRNFVSVHTGRTTIKAPNGFRDDTNNYISISNSFDGTTPYCVSSHDIRIVCANTQQMVLRKVAEAQRKEKGSTRGNFISGKVVSLKHSKNIHDYMEEALQAISAQEAWNAAYAARAEQLLKVKVTKRQFEAMVKNMVLSDSQDPRAVGNSDRKMSLLLGTWNTEVQSRGGANAWAALNAFTDLASHYSVARGTPHTPSVQIEIDRGFDNQNGTLATALVDKANTYIDSVLVKA